MSARIEDQLFSPAFETHNEALSGSQSAHHERIPKDEALFVSNSNKAQRSAELSHIAVKSQKKLAESDTSGDPILKLSESDEMLKRLLDIYRKAKNDFHATPPKSIERTKSAKFLRDTVENCLSYLAAKEIPAYSMMTTSSTGKATSKAELLHQLQETLEETIAIAEKGSGGKKRRFEENVEGVPQEPARMKGTLVESPDPVFKGLPSERKPAIRSAAREKRSRAPAKVIGHEDQQRIDMAGRRRSSPQFQPYLSSTPQSTRHSSGDPSKSHRERSPFRGPRYCDSYRPSYE